MSEIRVLVTAVGSELAFSVIKAIKRIHEPILLVGTDIYPEVVGKYWVDSFYQVPQVAENVAFGHSKESWVLEKIEDVLKKVDLLATVNNMARRLDTEVGENGANLSGGQKQRLIIARALYNDAEILVLDEATSNLDNQTEQLFINTVKELSEKSGITCIMIAHRYSTLKHCNKIVELADGEIAKRFSSYDELIKSI